MEDETKATAGERVKLCLIYHWRGWLVLLVPFLLSPLLFSEPDMEMRCGYIVLLMMILWVTEAIPIYVTSLIPIVAFPMTGILDSNTVCMAYFKDSMLLFFGGLLLALAIEYCNLHKRVGLSIMLIIGCSPRKLLFSMMFVTMFVSMWISNSAAAAMMCPVIKAVLEELSNQGLVKTTDDSKDVDPEDPPYPSRSVICYYLGMAYAATLGGCGTLIGTGTNIVFKGIYESQFPNAPPVDFLSFMLFNVPPMIVHLILIYFWLQWLYMGLFRPDSPDAAQINIGKDGELAAKQVIQDKRKELGPMTMHEKQVAILFLILVTLLITMKPGIFTGWADVIKDKNVKGSAPAMLIVFCLFVLPANYIFLKYFCCKIPESPSPTLSLITWTFVHKNMPWGLLFLLGGGLALSAGIQASGLSVMIGDRLKPLEQLPLPVTQFMCIVAAILLTNFCANVAICNILTPVVLAMAVSIKAHPLYLGLPTCMAISMAFHFPVGTPPNAIAAGYANVRTKDMMIAGIGPSLITMVGLFLGAQTLGRALFPGFSEFPDWAKPEEV